MMKFFTDAIAKWPYLLEKIKPYLKMREKTKKRYKAILIDPGIQELKKNINYSWEKDISIHNFLNSLPKNHYFSLDYPSNLNLKYEKYLMDKSWSISQAYCYHPQFIVTVQFRFNNYLSFVKNYDKYNELNFKSGILGIGNVAPYRSCNQFLRHIFDYAFSHCNNTIKRIHIYGLNFRTIYYVHKLSKRFNKELSIDSSKYQFYWQKRNASRPELFRTYIANMEKLGIDVEG